MKLKEYLDRYGLQGAKDLANCVDSYATYLYSLASGGRNPSAKLAIAIHRATKGQVTYKDMLPKTHGEIWPDDMFQEIEDWKKNNG